MGCGASVPPQAINPLNPTPQQQNPDNPQSLVKLVDPANTDGQDDKPFAIETFIKQVI